MREGIRRDILRRLHARLTSEGNRLRGSHLGPIDAILVQIDRTRGAISDYLAECTPAADSRRRQAARRDGERGRSDR
jgi:hypothetical protein